MTKIGFIIRCEYIEFPHQGNIYYINNKGYLVDPSDRFYNVDVYTTLRGCKIACTRMKRKSDRYADRCNSPQEVFTPFKIEYRDI